MFLVPYLPCCEAFFFSGTPDQAVPQLDGGLLSQLLVCGTNAASFVSV